MAVVWTQRVALRLGKHSGGCRLRSFCQPCKQRNEVVGGALTPAGDGRVGELTEPTSSSTAWPIDSVPALEGVKRWVAAPGFVPTGALTEPGTLDVGGLGGRVPPGVAALDVPGSLRTTAAAGVPSHVPLSHARRHRGGRRSGS